MTDAGDGDGGEQNQETKLETHVFIYCYPHKGTFTDAGDGGTFLFFKRTNSKTIFLKIYVNIIFPKLFRTN